MKKKKIKEINNESSIVKKEESIYDEKIKEIYKGTIYQIDLDNNHEHFMSGVSGDNNTIFKDNDIFNISDADFGWIIKKASFKPVKEILFYRSNMGKLSYNGHCREIITREQIPFYNSYRIHDEVKYNNMIVPVFLYYDGSVLATASELEEYLKYYTDKNNYNTDSEYFDVRIELKKQLDSLFADAKEDYLKFIESRDYSEHYKIEKVKEKYRQFF